MSHPPCSHRCTPSRTRTCQSARRVRGQRRESPRTHHAKGLGDPRLTRYASPRFQVQCTLLLATPTRPAYESDCRFNTRKFTLQMTAHLDAVDRKHNTVFCYASLQIIVSVVEIASCGAKRQVGWHRCTDQCTSSHVDLYMSMSSRLRNPGDRERTPSPAFGDRPS